jgi:hypothetical protein
MSRQTVGAVPMVWTTWFPCGCNSHPSGAEVTAHPPCGRLDNRRCEAGMKGGNPELGRESRRAELGKDRQPTYVRPVVILARLTRAYKPAQQGNGWRAGQRPSLFGSTLAPIPADSRVLSPATNGNQERGNPAMALRASALSRESPARRSESGIASEANAPGKARGYADGGAAGWMIGVQVGATTHEHVGNGDV